MRIGLFGINIGVLANPDHMVRVAQAAEQAGLDSVWTGEHVVLPDPQAPPSPSHPQTPFLDPAVALSHIAAVTTKLRLGTGIIILPQRNPLILAKELASVDVLSNGRLEFGLGAGYLEAEFRALGAPFEDRGAVTDEAIRVLQALWTEQHPTFDGTHFSFSGIDAQPRPVQKPHPPIVVGGMSKRAARRAAELGDGWYGFVTDHDATARSIAWTAQFADRRPDGKSALEFSVTPPPHLLNREGIDRYADLGVHRIIALSLAQNIDDALREVETLSTLLDT